MEAYLRHQTEEQQQAVVEHWASSGLTQAEFCRRENIPEWKLSTWKRRKLKAAGGNAPIKKRNFRASTKKRALAQTANLQKDWIAKQSASGLSAAEFCAQNGIALKNFYYWKQKHKLELSSLPVPASAIRPQQPSNPFVPVRLVPEDVQEEMIEVILPGGCKIKITEQTSLKLLSKILSALEFKC